MQIRLTEEVRNEIVQAIQNDLDFEELARKYGTSKIQIERLAGKLKIQMKFEQPEGHVQCTSDMRKHCYYGDPQGKCCNFLEIEGHSRIIKSTSPTGEVEYHNLLSSCGCYAKHKPRGLRGIIE